MLYCHIVWQLRAKMEKNWARQRNLTKIGRNLPYMSTIHAVSITTLRSTPKCEKTYFVFWGFGLIFDILKSEKLSRLRKQTPTKIKF